MGLKSEKKAKKANYQTYRLGHDGCFHDTAARRRECKPNGERYRVCAAYKCGLGSFLGGFQGAFILLLSIVRFRSSNISISWLVASS